MQRCHAAYAQFSPSLTQRPLGKQLFICVCFTAAQMRKFLIADLKRNLRVWLFVLAQMLSPAKIPVRQPDYANLPSLNLAKNVSATFILVQGNSTQHKNEHNSKKTFCLLSEKRTRSRGHKEIGIVRGEITKSQAK